MLISVRPPKHMRVELRDVASGRAFRDVLVSKHCSGHRQRAVVSRVYRLSALPWTAADGRSARDFQGIAASFCS